jgi:methyl-accepting chemotaxis protein
MKISFRNRILLTVAISCVICTAAAVFVSSQKLDEAGRRDLVEKSSAILSRIEVGAHYVAEMKMLDGVIAETLAKYPDGNLPEAQRLKILKTVPIYAAFQIGKMGAEQENYKFRIASDAPRQKDNQATPEELAVIQKFKTNTQLKEVVDQSPDGKYMLVSRPVRIMQERSCLVCHGDPVTSPWHNGNDILGYRMENMKDGDLRATFTIISSLEPVHAVVQASTRDIIIWGSLITCLAIFLGFMIIRRPVANLTALANGLSDTADEVASMSAEIASTSVELSSGATEQAAALEETAASMEEMSAMVTRNSENAEKSQENSAQSQNSAERGKHVVQEMIQSIEQIDSSNAEIMAQIEDSNRQFSEIVQVITDIGNKTKVINDIVFQTKLLSFNASVEAARAGEHGKGFAVVAEEVGNLAQMSGNAAAEITQMLDSSIQKVEGIVNSTKSKVESLVKVGKEKVESGTLVAKQCGEVLDEIVGSVQSVNQMVAQIADGSKEQSKGVQEINRAMIQLNSVTQQNTSASQESSSAAERLSSQAEILRESVQSVMHTLSGENNSGVVASNSTDGTPSHKPTAKNKPIRSIPSANDFSDDGNVHKKIG